MWVAVCPLLSQSHTWLPLTRRSVSPKGTGTAILTWRRPAYQTSIVCVPEIIDAADSGEDDDPAMSGSAGKPRFALSVSVAVIVRGSFACATEASSCAGVRLGRSGAAALASMAPARTAPVTMTAPAGTAKPILSRGRPSRSIAHLPASWSPRSVPGRPLQIASPLATVAGAAVDATTHHNHGAERAWNSSVSGNIHSRPGPQTAGSRRSTASMQLASSLLVLTCLVRDRAETGSHAVSPPAGRLAQVGRPRARCRGRSGT